ATALKRLAAWKTAPGRKSKPSSRPGGIAMSTGSMPAPPGTTSGMRFAMHGTAPADARAAAAAGAADRLGCAAAQQGNTDSAGRGRAPLRLRLQSLRNPLRELQA